MVPMIIFIVIIMRWTWCYWCFTSQMILCCLDLFRSQIFLKEIMIVVTVWHDKACYIFTNDSICIKTMIMLLITMVPMIIVIVFIIMGWTWYWWFFTFQMILGDLNLLCCQVFLEEVMIVITVWHDKTLIILTDDTIGIKNMIMVFMLRGLTSMVTVLLMMMVLLSRFFCWFAWILQWCWSHTVTS